MAEIARQPPPIVVARASTFSSFCRDDLGASHVRDDRVPSVLSFELPSRIPKRFAKAELIKLVCADPASLEPVLARI